jgi:hypothetical protein
MSEVYVGKNVGFACHIFGRELCRNRSETAFFGAWFRLRTFLIKIRRVLTMEDLEFINSRFFAIYAKSELLSDLFLSHCLFDTYEDMNFGWAVKGDSFFGEDEVQVDYNHVLSCDKKILIFRGACDSSG